MNRQLTSRLERLEQQQPTTGPEPWAAFSADEWAAMDDEQRAAVNAHKIYVGVSPNDWDDDEPTTTK